MYRPVERTCAPLLLPLRDLSLQERVRALVRLKPFKLLSFSLFVSSPFYSFSLLLSALSLDLTGSPAPRSRTQHTRKPFIRPSSI